MAPDKAKQNNVDKEQRHADITVALAGNPNSGKTSVFNNITGARQHVGNWPGVTVEKKEGWVEHGGKTLRVVDLPGTYSLTAFSIEEVVARDFVVMERPEVVVAVIDASNLERNLYLALQFMETGANVVFALNMMDIVQKMGAEINVEMMSELLGAPVVQTVARTNKGTRELLDAVVAAAGAEPRALNVHYGKVAEDEIRRLTAEIEKTGSLSGQYLPRWLALKLLEGDTDVEDKIRRDPAAGGVLEEARKSGERLKRIHNEDPEILIADRRYGFIAGLMKEIYQTPEFDRRSFSDKVDQVVANRVFGFPIFLFFMWATFQLTFTIGAIPMQWIEKLFELLGNAISAIPGDSMFESLIVDGIIGGVGGVLVFLPVILLLFLAIAFLEDSGYMARAAFIMDRVMHFIGLHGKSFIPMLVGFGCSVPAIMATRTLENRKDRILTILVIPLMSCGARLPVYVLLSGAFFSGAYAGHVIFSMYVIGILLAIMAAKVFHRALFPGQSSPFVMELPPYRLPTVKSILILMWERSWMYMKKAGTVILAIAIILWFLMSFPQNYPGRADMEAKAAKLEQRIETEPSAADEIAVQLRQLENEMAAEKLEHSVAGMLGKALQPVFAPLGFDWRASISLIAGLAAKEVVVSTLGTVYSLGEADEESESLRDRLRADPGFNPLKAYVLMLFVLISVPCMATLAVIRKETDTWKWVAFSAGYHFALAWVVCFVVYHVGRLAGLGG